MKQHLLLHVLGLILLGFLVNFLWQTNESEQLRKRNFYFSQNTVLAQSNKELSLKIFWNINDIEKKAQTSVWFQSLVDETKHLEGEIILFQNYLSALKADLIKVSGGQEEEEEDENKISYKLLSPNNFSGPTSFLSNRNWAKLKEKISETEGYFQTIRQTIMEFDYLEMHKSKITEALSDISFKIDDEIWKADNSLSWENYEFGNKSVSACLNKLLIWEANLLLSFENITGLLSNLTNEYSNHLEILAIADKTQKDSICTLKLNIIEYNSNAIHSATINGKEYKANQGVVNYQTKAQNSGSQTIAFKALTQKPFHFSSNRFEYSDTIQKSIEYSISR